MEVKGFNMLVVRHEEGRSHRNGQDKAKIAYMKYSYVCNSVGYVEDLLVAINVDAVQSIYHNCSNVLDGEAEQIGKRNTNFESTEQKSIYAL